MYLTASNMRSWKQNVHFYVIVVFKHTKQRDVSWCDCEPKWSAKWVFDKHYTQMQQRNPGKGCPGHRGWKWITGPDLEASSQNCTQILYTITHFKMKIQWVNFKGFVILLGAPLILSQEPTKRHKYIFLGIFAILFFYSSFCSLYL